MGFGMRAAFAFRRLFSISRKKRPSYFRAAFLRLVDGYSQDQNESESLHVELRIAVSGMRTDVGQ
jgi:hypothetical protein